MDELVSRDAEIDRLRSCVAGLVDGVGGCVWIDGEPGIGKSALVRRLLEMAAAAGCRSRTGRARPADHTAAYRSLARCLSARLPAGDASVAAEQRLLDLVERLCAGGPAVVVLDDLQWADDASLLTWRRLGERTGTAPLLLVAACRPVPRRRAVTLLRQHLADRRAMILEPAALEPVAASTLATALAGAVPGGRLRSLVDAAGGNPRYLRELIDGLVREHRIRIADGTADLVDAGAEAGTTAAAVAAHLGFLSPAVLDALRAATLLGSEFSVRDLSLVTGQPATSLSGVIREAFTAGVLTERGQLLTFRHPILINALYATIPASERADRHRRAATAMARAGLRPVLIAAQLRAAGAPADEWVPGWLGRVAPALTAQAPVEAVPVLEHVLQRPDLDGALRSELRWALAHGLVAAGRTPDALGVVAETLTAEALEPVWRARFDVLRAGLAGTAEVQPPDGCDDPLTAGTALQFTALRQFQRGALDAARESTAQALRLAGDDVRLSGVRAAALAVRIHVLTALGQIGPARELLAERHPDTAGPVVAAGAEHDFWTGRWEHAAGARLPEPGDVPSRLQCAGVRALIALYRDEPLTEPPRLDPGPADDDLVTIAPRHLHAQALWAQRRGRPDEALGRLAPLVRDGTAAALRQVFLPWLVRLAGEHGEPGLAEAAVRAAAADAADAAMPVLPAVAAHCHGLLGTEPGEVARAADDYERLSMPIRAADALLDVALLHARRDERDPARAAWRDAVTAYTAVGAAGAIRHGSARLAEHGVRLPPLRRRKRPETGWAALTPTEVTIARLVAAGRSTPDIATELFLSRRTVESHLSHIMSKLAVRSRIEVARLVPAEP
ncbi:AAA family ATPase [Dactylosporangium sucinum]|uniref:HTH luxR-type domain-containing protein n=1 Tax=Dactylosporangium sucinum TaxID=1424081 RepID=A0A917SZF0_9ACTN|nr:LuxR family transcriptional regulator [Dactylosporangium sucinum]GGM03586.1 hypothetical protein GCM10007977_001170 [Dactylosporangium sucinum]